MSQAAYIRILAGLVDDGIPACRPRLTIDGDTVAEVEGRGYCLLSWLDGSHATGPELSLAQATDFGALVGRIQDSLNRVGSAMGLPGLPGSVRMKVTDPAAALADADRYLAAAKAGVSEFDGAVVELLHRRKVLIDKFAAGRPSDDRQAALNNPDAATVTAAAMTTAPATTTAANSGPVTAMTCSTVDHPDPSTQPRTAALPRSRAAVRAALHVIEQHEKHLADQALGWAVMGILDGPEVAAVCEQQVVRINVVRAGLSDLARALLKARDESERTG